MSTGDKGGEYAVTVDGPEAVSWVGYADSAYDALSQALLAVYNGDVRPQ